MNIIICPICGGRCNAIGAGWKCEVCGERYVARGEVTDMTNADRIRAMSDEELAKFISIQSDDCLCSNNSKCDYHCGGDSCLKVLLDWLQQPAEEDT